MCEFSGQGWNLCHSSDLTCSSDNAGSWATRELQLLKFYEIVFHFIVNVLNARCCDMCLPFLRTESQKLIWQGHLASSVVRLDADLILEVLLPLRMCFVCSHWRKSLMLEWISPCFYLKCFFFCICHQIWINVNLSNMTNRRYFEVELEGSIGCSGCMKGQ